MCYLVGKRIDSDGCVAIRMHHGPHLSDFKSKLIDVVGYETIELLTVNSPAAWPEYAPYHIVDTESEFEAVIRAMIGEDFNAETIEAIQEVTRMKMNPALGKTYTNVSHMIEEILSNEKYEESLQNTPGPISLGDNPYTMDIPGIVRYAREKNVSLAMLTDEEKEKFIIKHAVNPLRKG